jgi:hypothetical protein
MVTFEGHREKENCWFIIPHTGNEASLSGTFLFPNFLKNILSSYLEGSHGNNVLLFYKKCITFS